MVSGNCKKLKLGQLKVKIKLSYKLWNDYRYFVNGSVCVCEVGLQMQSKNQQKNANTFFSLMSFLFTCLKAIFSDHSHMYLWTLHESTWLWQAVSLDALSYRPSTRICQSVLWCHQWAGTSSPWRWIHPSFAPSSDKVQILALEG